MAYNTIFLSIRMKLDDVIQDIELEKQIIENIRYCRRIVGKEFKIIFWNQDISENKVKDFIQRNDNTLFEINTQITKEFDLSWFLIGKDDKSKYRYLFTGDILNGIANYLKLVKVLKRGDN